MVGKPRIAAEICIPPEKLHEWFCHALRADDPKPCLSVCEKLVLELQVILNRQNNEELERDPTLPLWKSRDVSQEEWMQKRKEEFRVEANNFLVKVEEFGGLFGSEPWGKDGPSLDEITAPLSRIGAVPREHKPPATRGRPREAWHAAAFGIAWAIKNALKKEGLNVKDENSVVTIVGAKAITWAYKIKIKTAGFIAARERRHRKGGKRVHNLALEDIFQEFPAPTPVPDPPHILKR
jgi:hypothetical protein